jgi:L-alanine-DL-glutamate epimerase-like enolase superfamily enzyme
VLPLAAGENLYTRYEFARLLDAGTASVIQPDLSRCGGITEALRIASLASAAALPVCTHGCHTGLNFAASVHYLASIENAWYFEADGSTDNPLRTTACSPSYALSPDGAVLPLEGPGLGVDVDEDYLRAHPLTEGPAWRLPSPPWALSPRGPPSAPSSGARPLPGPLPEISDISPYRKLRRRHCV